MSFVASAVLHASMFRRPFEGAMMIQVRSAGLRGAGGLPAVILATAVAASVAVAPSASAASGRSFNDAKVVIRGGNSVSVATCVNWAQDWGRLSAEQRKRHDKRRVVQSNECDNTADAQGGSVDLTKVQVTVDQAGQRRFSKNSATVTISGGDAVAVAACLNVLKATASAEQTNTCTNTAISTGGNVTLENTDITIIQG